MKKQTILITGAGSGLGKGTAIGLAKEGYKVIAAVHTWEQMSRFKEDLKDTGRSRPVSMTGFTIVIGNGSMKTCIIPKKRILKRRRG